MARRPAPAGQPAMKGDRVEIVVDAGDVTKTYEVNASRAGRRVEVVSRRGLVEVSELTRGGATVRTARFMASRVIAVVEHPALAGRAAPRPRALDGQRPRRRLPTGHAARARPDRRDRTELPDREELPDLPDQADQPDWPRTEPGSR